ncbi:MAG: hypothetical protein GIW95_04450 [Candidatus Eremiobacteraeota bacterium]|nr:hypothetical protein [Candidatus Eremiobacteraeota bacterium]
MTTTFAELAELDEIVRIPSPAPAPQALAHDGEHLWLGSWETSRFYGIFPRDGRVFEDRAAPGRPVGATCMGDELRVICSENGDGDNRFMRRYIPGHGFKSHDAIACPDDTGSFLAWNGERLWMTQRHNKCAIELDAHCRPVRTIDVGEQILGATWVGERLYLSIWLGKERGGSRVAYIEPRVESPQLTFVASSPFACISLAYDGERLWTNDAKAMQIVAFRIPA